RGSMYYLHVRTLRPLSGKPVRDVALAIEFNLEDEANKQPLKATGKTNADGYALIALKIPTKLADTEGELKLRAQHGGFIQTTSKAIDIEDEPKILLSTDKSIYQPGQTIHSRALIFDSGNRALSGIDAKLEITDPEGTTVFKSDL